MKYHYYLCAQSLPTDNAPLPEPVVVASFTCDPRFIGGLNPHRELTIIAGKLGLSDFTIDTAEAQDLPGHQFGLPFPPHRRHRR